MRRIAKMTLLLAPLALATSSGCVSTNMLIGSNAPVTPAARTERLVAAAREYERTGRPEAALSVYQYILAHQPEHRYAKTRQDLLAQSGISPAVRDSKEQLREQLDPRASQTLLASHRNQSAPVVGEFATEAAAKNSARQQKQEEAHRLAMKQVPVGQPKRLAVERPSFEADLDTSLSSHRPIPADSAADHWTKTLSKPDVAARSGDDWTRTSSSQTELTQTSVSSGRVETATLAEDSWKTTATEVASASYSGQSAEDSSFLASKGSAKSVDMTPAWATTDLSRHQEPKTAEAPVDSAWSQTRLIALCEGLPEDLVPFVQDLESRDVTIRVNALQSLASFGEEAKPAAVAVHALLEDREAVVAVYAASTLREIANDAWSSVQTLQKHLADSDEQIVRLSAYMLGQMGPEAMEAVEALESLRDSGDSLTQLHAAEALTHIAPGDRRSYDKLDRALHSDVVEVRWFAAISLGTTVGDQEVAAVESLRRALSDAEPRVRVAACLSLGGMGDKADNVIGELEELLHSDSTEVRAAARTALDCLRG